MSFPAIQVHIIAHILPVLVTLHALFQSHEAAGRFMPEASFGPGFNAQINLNQALATHGTRPIQAK